MPASSKKPHQFELGETVRTPRGKGRIVGIEWGGDVYKGPFREWAYTVSFGPCDTAVFAEEHLSYTGRHGHSVPYHVS